MSRGLLIDQLGALSEPGQKKNQGYWEQMDPVVPLYVVHVQYNIAVSYYTSTGRTGGGEQIYKRRQLFWGSAERETFVAGFHFFQ